MTDFKNHKLSDTEREKITSICTTELLRLYKTDTDLNSRIKRYLNSHSEDNSNEAVKANIADCYADWNTSRLNDNDYDAAKKFVIMAKILKSNKTRFGYDDISTYTDEEQYSSPFNSFTHVVILGSWADWDKLCKDIILCHFSEIVDLVKKSSKRRKEYLDLLNSLLSKGD